MCPHERIRGTCKVCRAAKEQGAFLVAATPGQPMHPATILQGGQTLTVVPIPAQPSAALSAREDADGDGTETASADAAGPDTGASESAGAGAGAGAGVGVGASAGVGASLSAGAPLMAGALQATWMPGGALASAAMRQADSLAWPAYAGLPTTANPSAVASHLPLVAAVAGLGVDGLGDASVGLGLQPADVATAVHLPLPSDIAVEAAVNAVNANVVANAAAMAARAAAAQKSASDRDHEQSISAKIRRELPAEVRTCRDYADLEPPLFPMCHHSTHPPNHPALLTCSRR